MTWPENAFWKEYWFDLIRLRCLAGEGGGLTQNCVMYREMFL